MLNKVLALLESVIELEKDIRLQGEIDTLLEEKMLEELQIFLQGTPNLHSKYLKIIISISDYLSMAQEKPGSLQQADTSQETHGMVERGSDTPENSTEESAT